MQHPNLKINVAISRLTEGVARKCGKQDNGIYHEAQGSLTFRSGEEQYIDHHNQKVYNLIITGDNKDIENDITITGTLALISGIVTPVNNNIIIIAQDASITDASELSYINGALYHEGTGDKFYPIGKNGHYYPVVLTEIQGANPITGIEVFEPNPNPKCGPGLKYVSCERYWIKYGISGTFDGAYVSVPNTFTDLTDNDNLVIAETEEVGGVFTSLGNRYRPSEEFQSEIVFSQNVFSAAELGDISIKNVITPNNDDVNDCLYIENIDRYPDNEIILLNRLGQTVYTEKGYNNTWNAQVNGKVLPTGSYICIVKIGDCVYRKTVSILHKH